MENNFTPGREDLKAKLKRLGVTHEETAGAVGVNRSTVTLWLSGEVFSPALDRAIPAFVRAELLNRLLHSNQVIPGGRRDRTSSTAPNWSARESSHGQWKTRGGYMMPGGEVTR